MENVLSRTFRPDSCPQPDASLLRTLRPAYAGAAILVVAAMAVGFGPSLPPSLSGLTLFGPYALLLIGVAISAWFNRGRALVALASLLAAYAGYRLTVDYAAGTFAARAAFTCLAVFVPFNIMLVLSLPERGVSTHRNYRWLLLAAAELALAGWIASAGRSSLSGTSWLAVLDHWLLRSPPTPVAGRLLFGAAFALAAVRSFKDADTGELQTMGVGLAGALVASFIACEWAAAPGVFGAFMSAAGAILLLALLQESHRMAFRDPLTGLPGRRALEERLSGLGPVYSIAMVDVDHFKRFNDAYGHDVGDQVLKLVAARLAGIGGGGTAYRYGGEEFSVVFPEKDLKQALPHLEGMRQVIETYAMAVRGADRPKDEQAGTQLRARRQAEKTLSVTVSIGVAQRDTANDSASTVLRAADQALYRAKQAGRNRVGH